MNYFTTHLFKAQSARRGTIGTVSYDHEITALLLQALQGSHVVEAMMRISQEGQPRTRRAMSFMLV